MERGARGPGRRPVFASWTSEDRSMEDGAATAAPSAERG